MKVQAWKCPYTGKLFELEDRAKYIASRRKGRKEFLRQQEADNLRATWKAWLHEEKLKITRPEQIPAWFLKNQKKIMDASNAINGGHRWFNDTFVPEDEFTELKFSEPKFSERVSNTHCCPEGGVQNFMCDDTKPRGYVGWTSYVNGTLVRPAKHNSSYPYSGALKLVGIHTGTGGGENINFGYDIKIFLDDWPGLKGAVTRIRRLAAVAKVKREREEIIRRLKGRR